MSKTAASYRRKLFTTVGAPLPKDLTVPSEITIRILHLALLNRTRIDHEYLGDEEIADQQLRTVGPPTSHTSLAAAVAQVPF